MVEASNNTEQEDTVRGDGMNEDVFLKYMKDEAKLPKSLGGKVVAITGTTTGLGFYLARVAIVKGANAVLLLNRTSSRSTKSHDDLVSKYKANDSATIVETIPCDLMDFTSVKECASKVNEIAGKNGGLDVLCCNAGIMMMDDERTKDGFEIQMQTNQLSHALLMHLVWSSLKEAADKRGEARVVFQSSSARFSNLFNQPLESKFFEKCERQTLGGDKAWLISQMLGFSQGPVSRYHQSKLANSAFAMALHHKLQDGNSKIKSIGCEPGYSVTPLQTTSQHLPSWASGGWMTWMTSQSPADGCLNAAMACFAEEAESGDFYMPSGGLTGPPKKSISKGVAMPKEKEGDTCSELNQTIVWEGCEKALGVKFAV